MSLIKTEIPYLDLHWPVVTGCLENKPCWKRCWARKMAHRFHRDFTPTFHPEKLIDPLRSRAQPRTVIGLAFGGDLFVEGIELHQIAATFGIMAARPDLTFVLLTKRPEHLALAMHIFADFAAEFQVDVGEIPPAGTPVPTWLVMSLPGGTNTLSPDQWRYVSTKAPWPLPNVYLGFSAQDQASFDFGWNALYPLAAKGWHVWCSLEPMIGPVSIPGAALTGCGRNCIPEPSKADPIKCFTYKHQNHEGQRRVGCPQIGNHESLAGIILGAESGPGARPLDLAWVRKVRDQCSAAAVPFAYKQGPGDNGIPHARINHPHWHGDVPVLDGRSWTLPPWVEETPYAP